MVASDKPATVKNDWYTRFAGLGYACALANHAEAAGLLRAGWRLLDDPPARWHGSINVTLNALEFEAMLGAGAEDAAAVAILQDWAGFMLSHGPGGGYMATVVVEGLAGEASADGASVRWRCWARPQGRCQAMNWPGKICPGTNRRGCRTNPPRSATAVFA